MNVTVYRDLYGLAIEEGRGEFSMSLKSAMARCRYIETEWIVPATLQLAV